MEDILKALAIAGISGVTFLAYKHPIFYIEHFHKKISTAVNVSAIALTFYMMGFINGLTELQVLIDNSRDVEIIANLLDKITVTKNSYELLFLMVVVAFFYSIFLHWFAFHMSKNGESSE